jgi:hypothetical protein
MEEEEKENEPKMEYIMVDGHFTNLEALARKIQGQIIASGGEVHADEDASSHALVGFDLGAHITDDMDEEKLGQFLEEFEEAWAKVAGPNAPEAKK